MIGGFLQLVRDSIRIAAEVSAVLRRADHVIFSGRPSPALSTRSVCALSPSLHGHADCAVSPVVEKCAIGVCFKETTQFRENFDNQFYITIGAPLFRNDNNLAKFTANFVE